MPLHGGYVGGTEGRPSSQHRTSLSQILRHIDDLDGYPAHREGSLRVVHDGAVVVSHVIGRDTPGSLPAQLTPVSSSHIGVVDAHVAVAVRTALLVPVSQGMAYLVQHGVEVGATWVLEVHHVLH